MQVVRGRERGVWKHKKLEDNGVPHEGITWVNLPFKQHIIGNNGGRATPSRRLETMQLGSPFRKFK